MAITVRVPITDDVETDEDYLSMVRGHKKMINALSHQFAIAAAETNAMLKPYDEKGGRRRRYKVSRPYGLAAVALLLVARYLKLVERRFKVEYADEIANSRRRVRTSRRSMRFGG